MIKVTANNAYGDSEMSEANNAGPMLLVPYPPIDLTNDPLVTSASTIRFTWTEGPTGGSEVLDYFVYYD
jgi:hypothetical protein